MSHRRSAAILWVAAVSAAAWAGPDASGSFHGRFETPALEVRSAEDGYASVEIAGFGTRARRPGLPDIPWRTVLVAIPPGAEPRLEAHPVGPAEVVPGVVPRPIAGAPAAGVPAASGGEARAWLGRTGVLRDQRYVELHLAPVRFDALAGGLVRDLALDVTVHFDGGAGPAAGSAGEDPHFEAVYRRAFVNYEQGRSFRLGRALRTAPDGRGSAVQVGGGDTPIRRIVVRANGVVRLDHALFLAQAPEFLAYDPVRWRLASRGEQVRLDVSQSGVDPAALEPGEWVQFYGQALDDEPEQVLNTDTGGIEDIYEARDFSDENVYFLTVAAGPQPAMASRASAPGLGVPAADFPATAHAEVNDVFFPLAGAGMDYWLPLVSEAAPTVSAIVPLPLLASGTTPAELRVALRGVSQCDGFAPDHVSRVRLRNSALETLDLPPGNPDNVGNDNLGTFDGQTMFVHEFGWSHSSGAPELTDPLEVVVQVDNLPGSCPTGGVVRNDVIRDWIEVDYRRSFVATGDALTFAYPDGDAEFEITGLASGSGSVRVYEITGELGESGIAEAVRLDDVQVASDGPTFKARFRMDEDPVVPDGALRRFVVVGESAIALPAPADFRADRVSRLAEDTTQADLVVVAHPDLLLSHCTVGGNPCAYDVDCAASPADRCEVDAGSALGELLAYRATQGISSRVARIGDVEDEFHHGLSGPRAIRSFLEWTSAGGWGGPPPAFVLLLGDGSYGYKSGTAAGNYVPTQLMIKQSPILAFYASDNVLADVAGDDQLPDLAIGRVSARTLTAAETALTKILDYEANPLAGDWRGNSVFVSDRANDYAANEATEFERINQIGIDALIGTAYTSQNLRYWTDLCVPQTWTCSVGGNVCSGDGDCAGGSDFCRPLCDKVGMRTAIRDAVNGVSGPGAAIVQYMGHGNFDLWSSDVLFCANEANPACTQDDTASLVNGGKLPWLIVHNCLSGGFHSLPAKSFGEQWQRHAAGGAVAVFAPSGLGFRFLGEGVSEVIWEDLYGPSKERRLAVPVMDSLVRLCSQDSIEGCQFYTLLGDPTTTLALPNVDPPSDPGASGDNAVVHLSWTASATPGATYDVWRTKQLLPPYTLPYEKINASPITIAGYDDTNVVNAQDYYYYVVAVDADGFESRWSNFNSDCDVVGPDCIVATPINLTPPVAPSALAVSDAESGGRLDVRFDYNPEPDIDFYTVHYGTTPALGLTEVSYTNQLNLNGLTNGVTWFVAVTATNTSGVTSSPSATLQAVPTLVLGVHSPGFVGDLRISRSGTDAHLTWGAVAHDIYGKPTTIAEYEIYRGSYPEFVPFLGNRIATTPTTWFDDPGALSPAEPSRYYLVRAVDTDGNPGGLGHQLPNGTMGLVISRSTTSPGNIRLSWPAVTTDFDGAPAAIAGYQVFGADGPFDRAQVESGAVGAPLLWTAGTWVEIGPSSQSRYYSVLAVDPRGNRSPF